MTFKHKMMKKLLTTQILLAIVVLANAQTYRENDTKGLKEQMNRQSVIKDGANFKSLDSSALLSNRPDNLPKTRKIIADQDWWEPDTIYFTQYELEMRRIFYYNEEGYMLSQLEQGWENGTWLDNWNYIYTYDKNNNLQTYLIQLWYLVWINYYNWTYTYDVNNNLLFEIFESWDYNLGTWYYSYRTTCTYDENNNLLTKLEEYWYNGIWINNYKYSFTYDANNNVLTNLIEEWIDGTWENIYKETYSYEANNYCIIQLEQEWQNETWVNYYRGSHKYDSNNNRKLILWETWENETWENCVKWNYDYDENNNLLEELHELWKDDKWINDYRYLWTYDENDNAVQAELFEFLQHFISLPLPLYYNNMQSNFIFEGRGNKLTASYKKLDNPVPVLNKEIYELSVYPNPSSGELQIVGYDLRIGDLQIYDTHGRNVGANLRKCIKNEEMEMIIDISHLPKGIYYLKTGNNAVKFVKK